MKFELRGNKFGTAKSSAKYNSIEAQCMDLNEINEKTVFFFFL